MDRIRLCGIRVDGRHGADPGERELPQPFDVEIVAELDLRAAQASDALVDTLDYAQLYRRVVAIVQETSYALLERLAGDLLDAVFADRRVERAEVTIAKPAILGGATPSVTLAREKPHRAFVGLGANLGDAAASVEHALEELGEVGRVLRRSSLYRTRPWGNPEQPPFVNAVALIETASTPRELFTRLKRLEMKLGRVPGERWGPRAIDLDLLAYDDVELDEPELRVPHARLRERAFVLVPLAEIDASYASLRDALDPHELSGVERLR